MPLQNRVLPDGYIAADSWRGDFMGNRGGRIHDPQLKTLLKRNWASKRWICCVTQFKSRHRQVMGNGYTELFFLDEVSALAAGHRPCFECRRSDAKRFARFWAHAFELNSPPTANEMDQQLHGERIAEKRALSAVATNSLPDGTMIGANDRYFAIRHGRQIEWTGAGYTQSQDIPSKGYFLLTSPTLVSILAAGYQPAWHESANEASNGYT